MSTVNNNHENLKPHIPNLIDILEQHSEQQKMMEEIMESIFNHAAIASISNSIEG